MKIFRPRYLETLKHSVNDLSIRLVFLHGGRWSGKTTLLKYILSEETISQKKYYFSFEDDIIAKKFKDASDFKWYMQIKYGINFHENNVLLLNEIQYSKNFIAVLEELLHDTNIQTTIIATGIIPSHTTIYQKLVQTSKVITITVHPLWFFDFLVYRWIHTTYLTLDNPSPIMFKELQGIFDEYLTRWWYPEIVKSTTKIRKEESLKAIIQKVYDKDIGFYFQWNDGLAFQDIMEQFCYSSMEWFKYKAISQEVDISIPLLKDYINFLKENCLIDTLQYFYSDKTKELSNQPTIVINDMGIFSYITGNFWSKRHNLPAIKTFVYNEITKILPDNEECMTYQKTNNSRVDFVIRHHDDTLTVIVVAPNNTISLPKVLKWFHRRYGNRVRKYIKTTPLKVYQGDFEWVPFVCLPHFMISQLLS